MISTSLFSFSFLVYALALIASIAVLVSQRKWLGKLSFGLFLFGFLLHTAALLVRWAEAGEVEVAAFQQAEGRILQGWEWFQIWISHPPWSNLYESLVCFGWGMSLVSLVGIRRFNIPILPIFAISLSLLVMGAASLLINQEISPLVPALQSKWIHLHVTMATISYPAFGLAAILGFFYLLKDGVSTSVFGLCVAAIGAMIVLTVGGEALLTQGDYMGTIVAQHMGKWMAVSYAAQNAAGMSLAGSAPFKMAVPGVGWPLLISAAALTAATILYTVSWGKAGTLLAQARVWILTLGFVALSTALILTIYQLTLSAPFNLTPEAVKALVQAKHLDATGQTLVANYQLHATGPFAFSLRGNPFEFLLLVTAWLNFVVFYFILWKRDWLVAQLPDADKLDDFSYKTILFAFPFLTMLIITGAVWAYYAWGRYWGWDPKETWSLITWIVYSIYLHVRITHGWEGRWPAALATIGFGVVIFTYLGVNILLSGLHSYASG